MADDAARRKVLTVPGYDKKLVVNKIPNSGLWCVKYTGGGATPVPLQGSFTSENGAVKAIERWLGQKLR